MGWSSRLSSSASEAASAGWSSMSAASDAPSARSAFGFCSLVGLVHSSLVFVVAAVDLSRFGKRTHKKMAHARGLHSRSKDVRELWLHQHSASCLMRDANALDLRPVTTVQLDVRAFTLKFMISTAWLSLDSFRVPSASSLVISSNHWTFISCPKWKPHVTIGFSFREPSLHTHLAYSWSSARQTTVGSTDHGSERRLCYT